MTNDQRIDEIRERCEAATPGPWYNFGDWMIHTEPDVEHNGIAHEKTIGTVKAASAAFIAHAREDIPYLLEELAASQRREQAAKEDLTKLATKPITHCHSCAKTCVFPASLAPECQPPTWCREWQWRGHMAGEGEAE